jgi:hypothetical protein
MRNPWQTAAWAAGLAFLCNTASAGVVATTEWIVPLAPTTENKNLRLFAGKPIDPDKPVWVVYRMLAISADRSPDGEIVLDPALEMVPVPLPDMFVRFRAGSMDVSRSAGTK